MVTESSCAVFTDRDGTLIHDVGYLRDPTKVQMLSKAGESLRCLAECGFKVILVSNQSGIGRGLVTTKEAKAVHLRLIQLLASQGVQIHGAFYCPHAPQANCVCRKPSPGLLLRAADRYGVNLNRSYMVGNSMSDIEAGKGVGCRAILLGKSSASRASIIKPDAIAADWPAVLKWIVERADVAE